jgi:hypothetical protein
LGVDDHIIAECSHTGCVHARALGSVLRDMDYHYTAITRRRASALDPIGTRF